MIGTLIRFAVIPGLLLAVVTYLRCGYEQTDPDTAKLLSVNVATLAILAIWPVIFLRSGRAIGSYLLTIFAVMLLIRVPVGIAYAKAIDENWTVEGTGEPVRYIVEIEAEAAKGGGKPEDIDATLTGIMLTVIPLLFAMILSLITWSLVWAVGFRGQRTWKGHPAPSTE